jgi:hypothetical protein
MLRLGKARIREVLRRSHRRTCIVSAISFEERCIGALSVLSSIPDFRPDAVIAVDYDSVVRGIDPRDDWRKEFTRIAAQICKAGVTPVQLHAHSYGEIETVLMPALEEFDTIILDTTCFTKIHVLALAYHLSRPEHHSLRIIAYSPPQNYGFVGRDKYEGPSWSDILVAPLSSAAALFNESGSRGIIIPGHEHDRLIVAIGELEPSGGIIVLSSTPGRPDFEAITTSRNARLFSKLMRLRASDWTRATISVDRPMRFLPLVRNEIRRARSRTAPVIIYPFGPKFVVFCAAHTMSREYPAASWFVYPVPTDYPPDYSFGISETMWFQISD